MWVLWSVFGACTPGPEEMATGDAEPRDTGPEALGAAEEPPPPVDEGDFDLLFDPARLQEIHIELEPAAIEALDANGREYVAGVFEHDGHRLPVGVRLKGSSSYQDFSGKPAIKIKFDELVKDQRYAGIERLALNNLTGDPAQGREVVAYILWADAGRPVPRASLARVYVNGAYFGLYAALEGMDDLWAARRYADPTGDLWAANDDADLTPDGIASFVLNAGSGEGPVSLSRAAEVVDAWSTDFYGRASEVVDMESYLDFWAWCVATGYQDGYPYHLNDYFLYGDPDDGGRFDFSPWGLDETWSDGWTWGYGGGSMGWQCGQDPACEARLRERIDAALTVYESIDVPAIAETVFEISQDAYETDPRSHFSPADVAAARAALLDKLSRWPDTVRGAMSGP